MSTTVPVRKTPQEKVPQGKVPLRRASLGQTPLRKTLDDIGLLTQRRLIQTLRNPLWLIVSFSTPVLYLALFTPLLQGISAGHPSSGQVLGTFLPGILSLMAFMSGSTMGFTTIFELQSGLIERFRVTPASRLAILLGPILAGLIGMFVFDTVVLIVGWAFGYRIHWLGLLVLAVLVALLMIMFAAFSIAIALVTKEISSFAGLINGINLPLLLLAGVLLPISYGPLWLRVLAHINPLYYLVEAARSLGHGAITTSAVGLAFVVLTPLCVLTLAWATRVFRRAVA